MLFAISGSQGSGKTSVINQLKQLGYNAVERKTSRSILNDWNVSLQEVNQNPELTIKFQLEILQRKCDDELPFIDDNSITFTERTFSDLLTYSLVSLGKDNAYDVFLNEYYRMCLAGNASYLYTFYLKGGYFPVVSDGVRGHNQLYQQMVDLTMYHFTQQMTPPGRLKVIDHPDLDIRVEYILDTIRKLKGNNE